MESKGTIKIEGFTKWMSLEDIPELEGLQERCTTEYLQTYLVKYVKMRGVQVASASINTGGKFQAPNLMGDMAKMMPPPEYHDLPPFCEILIRHSTGKHTEEINVWVPLQWNGRFFGCVGGGNRTAVWTPEGMAMTARSVNMVAPLRNGFACVSSDGANQEPEIFGWGVDWEKKELDLELYHNWIDYSTHTMTVLGKAVTEAITGEKPAYSYIMGSSGGGRQVLAEAQKYPEDYDGYWSDCPCVSYNRMMLSLSWPAVVMNEYKNVLPPAKFEAFRQAAYDKAGGREAYYNTTEIISVDPFTVVGQETEAGPITELDATVMQKIWEGARTPDGEFLWYGMRPGSTAWGRMGFAAVTEVDGKYHAVPFSLSYISHWLLHDKDWKFDTLTIEGFEKLFRRSMAMFPDMDTENPDLRNLRDCGGKLILCHGVDDSAIYVDGTIDYYKRIIRLFGDKETAKEVARLLIVPGDDHGSFAKNGAGPSLATAMAALMNWVEDGVAPETIHGQRFDIATMSAAEEKDTPVY